MILAFDVGNSNIVIGAIENGNIIKYVRTRTDVDATSDEYAIKILDFINFMQLDTEEFDGAIVSSVVPELKNILTAAVDGIFGFVPVIVEHNMNTGIKYAVDHPSTVAGDFVTGAVAVKEYYGGPAIIMDFGTATTITVLDENDAFAGGAIIPGVRLGLKALASGTALLPEISLAAPEYAVSKNTVDCIRSGAIFGTAAMIDGMIERFEAELGYRCNLIATGGLASSIVKMCRHNIICDDDLLLKGLWILYERNK